MNRLELIAGGALLLMAAQAHAGNFNPALEDPTVTPPQCVWFGFIPCHTGFDYDEPEGDTTPETRDTLRNFLDRPEPEPEVCE